MIYKTLHRKLKVEQHERHQKKNKKKKRGVGELRCSGSVSSSCSTSEVSLFQDNIESDISLSYIYDCTFPFSSIYKN